MHIESINIGRAETVAHGDKSVSLHEYPTPWPGDDSDG